MKAYLLTAFTALTACATTDAPRQIAAAPALSPAAPSPLRAPAFADTASGTSFGSPVVTNHRTGDLAPRWVIEGEHGRLRCEGSTERILFSGQSPWQPASASVARSFGTAETAVRNCAPPSTPHGRLPIHAVFMGSGAPQEYIFPGVDVSEGQAMCLGRSLCSVRLPTFRQVSAAVDYEFPVTDRARADD